MNTIDYNDRFWKHVDKNICWIWTRARSQAGYGILTINYEVLYAHRLSWEFVNGDIPDGMVIMHNCDNPACVNPEHLQLGTQKDNLQDMWKKNRGSCGENHICAKITNEDVYKIRRLSENENLTRKEIGNMFGLSRQAVTDIIYRRTWKHI
jgi:hypothetical protein